MENLETIYSKILNEGFQEDEILRKRGYKVFGTDRRPTNKYMASLSDDAVRQDNEKSLNPFNVHDIEDEIPPTKDIKYAKILFMDWPYSYDSYELYTRILDGSRDGSHPKFMPSTEESKKYLDLPVKELKYAIDKALENGLDVDDSIFDILEYKSKYQSDRMHTSIGLDRTKYYGENNMRTEKDLTLIYEAMYNEDYELYHDTYTSAINTALDFAERNGYEYDQEEVAVIVGMNSSRPKDGETERVSIPLNRDGKPQREALQIQVYNRGIDRNTFELNCYIL